MTENANNPPPESAHAGGPFTRPPADRPPADRPPADLWATPAPAPASVAAGGPAHRQAAQVPYGAVPHAGDRDPYVAGPPQGAGHVPWAELSPAERRRLERSERRATLAARLPQEAVEYQHVLRGPQHRWWRPLLALTTLMVPYLLIMVAGGIVLGLVMVASGSAFTETDPTLTGLDLLDFNDPVIFVASIGSLAILIPFSMLAVRVAHGVRPGYLSSVAGRFRWGWAARCVAVILPLWVIYLGVLLALDGGFAFAPPRDWAIKVLLIVFLVPLQAAGEEYAFRGLLIQSIGSWFRNRWAALVVPIVLGAVVFALLHGSLDPWVLFDLATFAALAGYLTWRTGGLEAAVVVHAVNNVVLFLLDTVQGDLNRSLVGAATSSTAPEVAPSIVTSIVVAVLLTKLADHHGVQRLTLPAGPKPTAYGSTRLGGA